MELPRFLLADHSKHPDSVFVVHTEYPRFVINMANDDVVWFEEFSEQDIQDLESEVEQLIALAGEFYDHEISSYEKD